MVASGAATAAVATNATAAVLTERLVVDLAPERAPGKESPK
jgi:hypothetical protein